MSDTKYVPPKVWTWDVESGGRFANINRPVSGATHEKELPTGKHPLQLYSLGTPNGIKVTILLEELLALGHEGAEYDAFLINIGDGAQFGSGFVEINTTSFTNLLSVVGKSDDQTSVAKITRSHASASNDTYTLDVDSSSHTSNMTAGGAFSVKVNSGKAFKINGNGSKYGANQLEIIGSKVRYGNSGNAVLHYEGDKVKLTQG